MREHAESIAFYSGDVNEKEISATNFRELVLSRILKIKWLAGALVRINSLR